MPAGPPSSSLINYDNPPIVETVLGAQFERFSGFTNSHLGAFWKTLDQVEWPITEDAPPLPTQIERFDEAARWAAGIQFQLTQDPVCRSRIKNQRGDRMIQVQNSRLHVNWLGEHGGAYPRYEQMRDEFSEIYRMFSDFLVRERIGEPKPNQWEIVYVNHIRRGSVWQTPNDWHFFKLLGTLPTIENVARAESFQGEWHFVIPEDRGRLHIEWQHAKKSVGERDSRQFIKLSFTARGPLEHSGDALDSVLGGLNLGRETIVTAFKNFASDDANTHWGLKHDG